MSQIETLLAKLPSARRIGEGKWLARCPAHEDKSPSLSIRYAEERVLVHCFAGCEPDTVLAALGLRWADLSDSPRIPDMPRARRPYLDPLDVERAIVRMAVADAGSGVAPDIETRARVAVARERLAAGARMPDQSGGGGIEAQVRAALGLLRLLESSVGITCEWSPRIDSWETGCGAEVQDYADAAEWKYCPACGRALLLEEPV